LSRLTTAFVLGYPGCDARIAEQAVAGEIDILQSERAYDWLGPGAYFWEADPLRAREWAEGKVRNGQYARPAVIGAVIDLGACLDLSNRENIDLVKGAYASFCGEQEAAGLALPENRNPVGVTDPDRLLRFLDCAVIKHLHATIEGVPPEKRIVPPFDTVRGVFFEGDPIYSNCGFHERTHVQIAVRNSDCIKGIFHVRKIP